MFCQLGIISLSALSAEAVVLALHLSLVYSSLSSYNKTAILRLTFSFDFLFSNKMTIPVIYEILFRFTKLFCIFSILYFLFGGISKLFVVSVYCI